MGVVRYELGQASAGDVRFVLSPMSEMGLSLRALRAPERFPLQLHWIRRTEPLRSGLDLEVLQALVTPPGTARGMWTPDFLTPYSTSPLRRIEDEFEAMARMSVAEFERQIVASHGVLPEVFSGPGRSSLERTVQALRDYWDACLAPSWQRMRATLEADIVHRGRTLAARGLTAMINDIGPQIRLVGSSLEVRLRSCIERSEQVGEGGLVLMPTLFTRRASVPVLPGEGAVVMYTARGQGAMWQPPVTPAPQAVADLIGAGRARVLSEIDAPVSTSGLAARLGVTPSAVSQHLKTLHAAGLVASVRHGRAMLHTRTDLGERLLGRSGTG